MTVSPVGTMPSTVIKIIPGNRKLLKGEFFSIDKGIPNKLPEGEMISTAPPNIAPKPRKASKKINRFRVDVVFKLS